MHKKTIFNLRRKSLAQPRQLPMPTPSKLVFYACQSGITFLPISQESQPMFEGLPEFKKLICQEFIPLINRSCSKIWFENYLFGHQEKQFEKIYGFLKFISAILFLLLVVHIFTEEQTLPSLSQITIIVILLLWVFCACLALYIFFTPFSDFKMDIHIKQKIRFIVRQYNTFKMKSHGYLIRCDEECLWISVSRVENSQMELIQPSISNQNSLD